MGACLGQDSLGGEGGCVSAISVGVNLEMEVRNENGSSLNQLYRLGADIIC